MVATVAEDGGGPAALVRTHDGGTLLSDLVAQLGRLGIDHPVVLVAERWCAQVRAHVGAGVACRPFRTPSELFGVLAEAAETSEAGEPGDDRRSPLLVLRGETVTHDGLLADLLATGRTTVLSDPGGDEPGLRVSETGQVTSAGSARHRVSGANAGLLPALRVAAGDRAPLADAAREIAEHAKDWPQPEADMVALLTVALVRRGAEVGTVPAGGYVWATPASLDELRLAEAALDRTDAERVHLDRVVKSKDGFFATFAVSPFSKHLARWSARLGLTPNHLTAASLVVGLGATGCFAVGTRGYLVAGAVLLQVSFVLDCADGQLARYTRNFSAVGAWLDATSDRVKEYAVYVGLALGAVRAGDDVWTLAAAALALQTCRHMVDFGFAVGRPGGADQATLPFAQVDDVPVSRAPDSLSDRPRRRRRSGSRAVSAITAVDALPGVIWVKRVVILPIGERWVLISLTAALASPRVTFTALLALGGLAAAYTTTGRVLRTVGR